LNLITASVGLQPYVLVRWCCPQHGWFETRTKFQQRAATCPKCGDEAGYVSHCTGVTRAELIGIVTPPRLYDSKSDAGGYQITDDTGITTKPKSDRDSTLRGGKRSGAAGPGQRKGWRPEPVYDGNEV
jgi:hypothetical protein